MAASLAERGTAVISGGAYGIDASAHRGALATGGVTVAVLAGGLEFGYPRGHSDLFRGIAAEGVLVSECPPDSAPTRPGFLVRNRIIAALSHGTVVVEAALRSGALNTARHARELCRQVMAVPGPVTSEFSAGCHELIRDYGAMCVTSAADVRAHLGLADAAPPADDLTGGLRLGPGWRSRWAGSDHDGGPRGGASPRRSWSGQHRGPRRRHSGRDPALPWHPGGRRLRRADPARMADPVTTDCLARARGSTLSSRCPRPPPGTSHPAVGADFGLRLPGRSRGRRRRQRVHHRFPGVPCSAAPTRVPRHARQALDASGP